MTAVADNAKAQPADLAPQSFQFTRDQYLQLADAGLFDNKRVELVNGKIYEMPPQSRPHRFAVSRLIQLLAPQVDTKRFWPNAQSTLEVSGWLPEPDFLVMHGTDVDGLTSMQDAALVIEISHSSLSYDLNEKAGLYATGGVKELWVFDVNSRKLIVLTNPTDTSETTGSKHFSTRREYLPHESVSPQFDSGVVVKIADILPVMF